MKDFKITMNLDKFKKQFSKYPKKLAQAGHDIIDAGVKTFEAEGKEAVLSGPTRAFDTGNLMRMIRGNMTGFMSGIVRSGATYSAYIHEGTKYMRARPFFEVAVNKGEGKFMQSADYLIKRALS